MASEGETAALNQSDAGDLTLGDAAPDDDPHIAALEDIYLDGTLVLVGCGKAKRDPEDPVDVHEAVVGPGEQLGQGWQDKTGPAWEAQDLYTSSYFAAKRDLAEVVTAWTQSRDGHGWGILSAEHAILSPTEVVQPYDTTLDDLGDDPTNPEHHVNNSLGRRRPDGREIVTEMDRWAANVAYGLCRWVAQYREDAAGPIDDADTLLVLAGQDYVEPLRERGVFEYGIARMAGDPNEGLKFPLRTRFLFEEIDAGGIGDQMAWLSDAVERLNGRRAETSQSELVEGRECTECGATPPEASLVERDGTVYCEDCHPRRCARCDAWTKENGLGGYALCPDCQTERGGQIREDINPDTTEQTGLIDSVAATDGGDEGDE